MSGWTDETRELLKAAGDQAHGLSPSAKARLRAQLFAPRLARRPLRVLVPAALILGVAGAFAATRGGSERPPVLALNAPRPAPAPAPPLTVAAEPAPDAEALRRALDALKAGRAEDARQVAATARGERPDGAFAAELLRVELKSLLVLHREAEALAVLAATDVATLNGGLELTVLRAELWARQGRCDRALIDRAFVLGHDPPPVTAERAKAVCPKGAR
jgi:hypothetical protein